MAAPLILAAGKGSAAGATKGSASIGSSGATQKIGTQNWMNQAYGKGNLLTQNSNSKDYDNPVSFGMTILRGLASKFQPKTLKEIAALGTLLDKGSRQSPSAGISGGSGPSMSALKLGK